MVRIIHDARIQWVILKYDLRAASRNGTSVLDAYGASFPQDVEVFARASAAVRLSGPLG